MPDNATTAVHNAIGNMLDEGEIAICWVLTGDVAGPDDMRYLAHRSGGGHDGTDHPMAWTAAGMLQSSADLARDQMRSCAVDDEEEGEEADGE